MKPIWHNQGLRNIKTVAIPLIVSVLFLAPILVRGVPLGRDFKGGSLVMVKSPENELDIRSVESAVEGVLGMNVDIVRVENGIHIETDLLDENGETNVRVALARFGIPTTSVAIEPIGPTITAIQNEQALYSIIVAFIVIGVISYVVFRRLVVPLTMLLVVGLDILCVLGYMALLQVPLGTATIIGILMLICLSIDTNILLAWRVLRRTGGEPREQATSSINTGMTMSVVAILILLILNILTSASQLNLLTAVLVFGAAVNIFNTWFLGAGVLLRHAERQRGKVYHVSL